MVGYYYEDTEGEREHKRIEMSSIKQSTAVGGKRIGSASPTSPTRSFAKRANTIKGLQLTSATSRHLEKVDVHACAASAVSRCIRFFCYKL